MILISWLVSTSKCLELVTCYVTPLNNVSSRCARRYDSCASRASSHHRQQIRLLYDLSWRWPLPYSSSFYQHHRQHAVDFLPTTRRRRRLWGLDMPTWLNHLWKGPTRKCPPANAIIDGGISVLEDLSCILEWWELQLETLLVIALIVECLTLIVESRLNLNMWVCQSTSIVLHLICHSPISYPCSLYTWYC